MKKLILLTALILVAGTTFGQTLQKGSFISQHLMTLNIDPDVTMNQYLDFYVNKYIPEFEKNFPGAKLYIAKGISGENKNSFSLIYLVDSKDVKDKFVNEDGTLTELGSSGFEKLQPTTDELEKLGTYTSTTTEWVIQ